MLDFVLLFVSVLYTQNLEGGPLFGIENEWELFPVFHVGIIEDGKHGFSTGSVFTLL